VENDKLRIIIEEEMQLCLIKDLNAQGGKSGTHS